MKKTAVYARVSTDHEDQKNSVENQELYFNGFKSLQYINLKDSIVGCYHLLLTHYAIPATDNKRQTNYNKKAFKEDIKIDVNVYLNLI